MLVNTIRSVGCFYTYPPNPIVDFFYYKKKTTTKTFGELEAAVEKTKDAAVLFTCEMAEHIKAEVIFSFFFCFFVSLFLSFFVSLFLS